MNNIRSVTMLVKMSNIDVLWRNETSTPLTPGLDNFLNGFCGPMVCYSDDISLSLST